jgi:hypothetical protein
MSNTPIPPRGIQVGVGTAGVTATVIGASLFSTSAATVIIATGGAAALALAGYGLYKWLSSPESGDKSKNKN